MRRLLVPAITLAFISLLCAEARAGTPTERLRDFFDAAVQALDLRTPLAPEERLSAIRAMVRDIVDFQEAARLSLGQAWNARTPGERQEFVGLFADLLEHSLIMGIAGRVRLPDGVRVTYLGEAVDGAAATVWTTIAGKTGVDLPFTYRMIERAGRWAVRDVVIDGVSLTTNYRAQFSRVLGATSYQGLVRQMRARSSDTPVAPAVAAAGAGVAPVAPAAPASPLGETRLISGPMSEAASHEEMPPPDIRAADATPRAGPQPPVSLALEVTLIARTEFEPTVTARAAVVEPAEDMAMPTAEPSRTRSQPADAPSPPSLMAAKAVPAAGGRPAGNRTYWVQVGAFKSVETAWRLAAALVEQEPQSATPSGVAVEPVTSQAVDAPVARVRIGPFADRRAAAAKLREVEARGHQPFIADERY